MNMEFKKPSAAFVECSHIEVRLHYTAHAHNPLLHHMAVQMPSGMLLDEHGRVCNVYYEYWRQTQGTKDPQAFRAKFQRVAANFKRFF